MPWFIPFVIAAAAAVVAKAVYDTYQRQGHAPSPLPPPYLQLPTKGTFTSDSVLVIGRTGAGKSSLINMLKGENILAVGHIGSTTRWLEGVPVNLGLRTVTFVDSPGIGEAFTSLEYHNGIMGWFSRNHHQVRCILLVLQSDSKAHADDKRLLDSLRTVSFKPFIIALNHADKIKPIRKRFICDHWEEERKCISPKSLNIMEKIVID